ncbi:unnamed protein product [Oikopleura dioica]|uniref:MH2 domain-containing protein n=1 Tax=Oikopleura dioica TaxID=34765 RepID=E4XWJ6_OIKDI|nr:unnamed protein product [Oikopleura dioica]
MEVANRPSTINYNDVSSPQSSSMDTSIAVPSVASVEQVVPEQIVDPTKQQEDLLIMLKQQANAQDYWCSISYYEFNERVGEVWHAPKEMHSVFIDGFTQPSDGSSSGNRFSLGLLTNINRKPESDSARRYIGRGCTVYTDNNDSVFLYNMSESSIFVQSPICNLQHSWHPATVVKIPPQGCIEIFSNTKYEETLCSKINSGYEETFFYTYVCKIRISFVKGWGAQYRRQTVTACPCWVELRLNKPLGVLDAALKTILKNPSGEPPGSSLSFCSLFMNRWGTPAPVRKMLEMRRLAGQLTDEQDKLCEKVFKHIAKKMGKKINDLLQAINDENGTSACILISASELNSYSIPSSSANDEYFRLARRGLPFLLAKLFAFTAIRESSEVSMRQNCTHNILRPKIKAGAW